MDSFRKVGTCLFLCAAAVCLAAGAANAQEVSSGAFTLPHAAQWGKYTLPKGSYNYTVRETGLMASTVTIKAASGSSRGLQMMGLQRSPEASLKGADSAVVLTHGKNGDELRGIYIAANGVEYVFHVQAKRRTVMAEDAKPAPENEVTLRIPIRIVVIR